MVIDFKFNIDEMVVNKFGIKGMVEMCGIDNTGFKQYYIKQTDGSNMWWKEDHLQKAE
jgi:hypothetical protein